MIIRVTGKTTLEDIGIDNMDFILPNGDTINVDADEESAYTEDSIMYNMMKGVLFDDEYANGRASELQDAKITIARVFSFKNDIGDADLNDPEVFQLKSIEIEDRDELLQLSVDEQPEFIFVED